MIDEARTVATPDGDMGVVVVRPDGDGPFPVVVLFHHGPGLDDGIRQALLVFARAGYLVAAPDRYHRHGSFLTVDVARLIAGDLDAEASRRFREMAGGVTDAMVESDLVALLDHLAADPAARGAPMACAGYCIGARAVLRSLAAHPDVFAAGALFHPSYCVTEDDDSPHLDVAGLAGALYVAIGGEDRASSAEDNRPLTGAVSALGDRGAVDVLAGADHGFAVPGPRYHPAAAEQAYGRALAIFDEAIR